MMPYFEGLNRLPMLRLLIPVILGIVLQHKIRVPLQLITVFIISLFLLLCTLWKYKPLNASFRFRWLYGFFLNIFVLLVAMGLMDTRMNSSSFMDFRVNENFVIARVLENPGERERSLRLLIQPLGIISGDSIVKTTGRAVAWIEKDSLSAILIPGDRIIIPGQFREINNAGNPYEFDYKRYMNIQGIYGETYIPAGSWFRYDGGAGNRGLWLASLRLRNHLLEILKSNGITGREYSVASALILGYRSGLDNETRQIYAGSGAMHILAVSGLHVGILYLLLAWMLGFLKNIKYYSALRPVIIILIIWFYALLTGLSPSVTRSATMFSFIAVARLLEKPTSIFNTLSSAALVQLIINPFSLFMVGFQLSYLAVAGIAAFQPAIYSLLRSGNPVTDRLWALISLSFSAQVLIFPLIMYYFNHFPSYFLLTNIFAVPLAMLILYSGMSLFVVSFVPVLAAIISFVLNIALLLLNYITTFISLLPYARISNITLSIPLVLILYSIILSTLLFIVCKKVRFMQFAFLLVIAAFVLRADYRVRTARQNFFMVYNARGESVYNFISGKDNILVTSGHGEFNGQGLPYVAAGTARHRRADNLSFFSHDVFFDTGQYAKAPSLCMAGGSFVYFAGNRIYFAGYGDTHDKKTGNPVTADILVISSRTKYDLMVLSKHVIPGIVVIDSSVPYYQKARLIDQCREYGLTYHDVSASGAFIAGMSK
jgi:competence protein ComEC